MAIGVHLCCNDDYGNFTGKATRVEFTAAIDGDFIATCEDTLWPPSGVVVRFTHDDGDGAKRKHFIQLGRGPKHEIFSGPSYGGNIFWQVVSVSGVAAVQMINYLMRLKYWDCTEGEVYIMDQFEKRQSIDPKIVFNLRGAGDTASQSPLQNLSRGEDDAASNPNRVGEKEKA